MPKCKNKACGKKYERTHGGIETWCSVDCGMAILKERREKESQKAIADKRKADKAFKRETAAMKKKQREESKKWWAAKARKICHLYIRTRDAKEPCFTCGTTEDVVYAAGHFIPDGRAAALRYDERNIHKQCNMYCNKNLSGNVGVYRSKLVRIHGEEYVQELEQIGHTKKTWTIPELKEVIEYYDAKLKVIK